MKFPLFRRSARPDTISALYGMIVAQARLSCFYRDYTVADTVSSRVLGCFLGKLSGS
jgi:cytochrome b pre-mRNA-processing protein 3